VGDKVLDWNTKPRLRALQDLLGTLPDPSAPLPKQKRQPKPNRAKRLKDDQVAELCQAYEGGTSRRQLADHFGIAPKTVSAILKRQGVKTRWRKLAGTDVDEAERLYAQGMSLARVGERLGVTDCAVRYQLRKRGVRMRDSHGRE
jgi:predicted transcriptional regulator